MYDLETVKAWARAEISAVPDGKSFIYKEAEREFSMTTACKYYEDGAPSCLIGRMLDRNGVITSIIEDREENSDSVHGLLQTLELHEMFTQEARMFMKRLQCHQDNGRTWGFAYERAIEGV